MNLNLNQSFVMPNSVCEKPPLYRHGKLKKKIGWRSQSWLPNGFTKRHIPVPPTNSGRFCMKQTNFLLVVQLGVFSHWHVISEIANNLNMDPETKLCKVSVKNIFHFSVFVPLFKIGTVRQMQYLCFQQSISPIIHSLPPIIIISSWNHNILLKINSKEYYKTL